MLGVRRKSSLFGVGEIRNLWENCECLKDYRIMDDSFIFRNNYLAILIFKYDMFRLDIKSKWGWSRERWRGWCWVCQCYNCYKRHWGVPSRLRAVKLARQRLSWIPRSWAQTRALVVTRCATLLVDTRHYIHWAEQHSSWQYCGDLSVEQDKLLWAFNGMGKG